MSVRTARGPIVIDTDVFGADIVPGSRLSALYEPIIVGRPAFICFQTAAELRYGALRRGWGEIRMRKLEARINEAEIVHSGPELVLAYARLPSIASGSGTRSTSVTTTPTVGSPPQRFASGSLWCPMTESSRTFRGCYWRRRRTVNVAAPRLEASQAGRHCPELPVRGHPSDLRVSCGAEGI